MNNEHPTCLFIVTSKGQGSVVFNFLVVFFIVWCIVYRQMKKLILITLLALLLPEATHKNVRVKRSAILHNRFMMLPADSSNESKLSPMYESLSF